MIESRTAMSAGLGSNDSLEAQMVADVRAFLLTADEPAACRLFEAIRGFARRTAHGGSRSERESFADMAPMDVMYPRDSTGTSRLELFDLDHPFLPWLRTVLSNLWVSHLDGMRRAIVNSDLLHGATARPEPAELAGGTLPALSESGMLTPDVVARLSAATNTSRLVAFLSMSGLHRHFPGWETLLQQYESEKRRKLPRPFPSMAVEVYDTPRTRTAPLAQEMGISKNNTLTQNWRRACTDIRAAFPELVEAFPSQSSPKTPTGERR